MRVVIWIMLFWGLTNQQTGLNKMQGMWADLRNGYDENNELAYLMIHRNKGVSIGYIDKDRSLDFFMIETVKGFLDTYPNEDEGFNVNDLQAEGEYYVSVYEDEIKADGKVGTNSYFFSNININDGLMVISSNGEQRYAKIEHLPSLVYYLLYNKGELISKDYLRIYLDANITKVSKDSILLEPTGIKQFETKLVKNDLVEIKAINDTSLFVEHITKDDELIAGWIPKNAVKKTQFTRKVAVPKTYIYSTPEEKTKMYLIKNDEIELVEKAGDFWRMKYTTAKGKVIEGYVKRIDCW